MLKSKVVKQPTRSIPPPLALLWICLLAQIHAFPLSSQVQWYQQLFLLLAQGSISAAGHLCQTAPFFCWLCIPVSSRKVLGTSSSILQQHRCRRRATSSPSRVLVHLFWAIMSLFLRGGSSSSWLLCRKWSRRWLFSTWPGWAPKGSQELQSASSLRPAASEEIKVSKWCECHGSEWDGKRCKSPPGAGRETCALPPNKNRRSGFSPDSSWKVEQASLPAVPFGFCDCCMRWKYYYFRRKFWKLKLAALEVCPCEGAEIKVKGCFRCNWLLWALQKVSQAFPHFYVLDGRRVGNYQTEVQELLFLDILNLNLVSTSSVNKYKWQ